MSNTPYKVQFVWKKTEADKGVLNALTCNGQDIPNDALGRPYIANSYTQFATFEAHNACLTVKAPRTLRPPAGTFIYLDVGRWLHGADVRSDLGQPGGIVFLHSQWRYASRAHRQSVPGPVALPGVTKTDQLFIPGNHPSDWNAITIILPDTHVPAVFKLDTPRPATPMPANQYGSYDIDQSTYDSIVAMDYFGSRHSIYAMTLFLSTLAGLSWAKKIDLVQVGDMYELWAGRSCYFQRKPGGPPGVAIDPSNVKTVADWICNSHEFQPELFAAYDRCATALKQFRVIHGNHDSYLSDPTLVSEANTAIDDRVAKPNGYMVNQKMIKTIVHRRVDGGAINENGVYIEHGQRRDAYNADGNPDGHQKMQSAMGGIAPAEFMAGFDSTRRESFVTAAAAMWVTLQQGFGVYVMGHTHSPVLNKVEVTHIKGDYEIVQMTGQIVLFTQPF